MCFLLFFTFRFIWYGVIFETENMTSQEVDVDESVLDAVSLNESLYEEVLKKGNAVDPKILDRYIYNRAIDEPAYTSLIFMYCVLIIVGALGNTLVVSF